MKMCLTISLIVLCVLSACGQIRKSELTGKWTCENNDSLYYRSRYITLYSDSSFRDQGDQCNFIQWMIDSDRVLLTTINNCSDNGILGMSTSLVKYAINLKSKGGRRSIIELSEGERIYERFRIVEFRKENGNSHSPYKRIFKLKRVRYNALSSGS